MEVTKIKEGGFCVGVRLALEKAEAALAEKGAAYAYSPLVHNEAVTGRLFEKGLRAFDETGDGDTSLPVVLSAHGHPPTLEERLRKAGFAIVDATCPFVKANEEAIRRSSKDHDIIYLGQEGHEEAAAALAFAGRKGILVDPSRPFCLPDGLVDPLVYVQTTLSRDDIDLAYRLIKERYPEAKLVRGPCRATEERQRAVKQLDESYDLILVVGSRSSANARALLALAQKKKARSLLVSGASELKGSDFGGCKKAAVIGAASTDEAEIDGVVAFLEAI